MFGRVKVGTSRSQERLIKSTLIVRAIFRARLWRKVRVRIRAVAIQCQQQDRSKRCSARIEPPRNLWLCTEIRRFRLEPRNRAQSLVAPRFVQIRH